MGRFSGKTCRLATMLALTFSFFLVELIYGHVTHSLALIGDSYHMLSDVVALVVGIASVRVSVQAFDCNESSAYKILETSVIYSLVYCSLVLQHNIKWLSSMGHLYTSLTNLTISQSIVEVSVYNACTRCWPIL